MHRVGIAPQPEQREILLRQMAQKLQPGCAVQHVAGPGTMPGDLGAHAGQEGCEFADHRLAQDPGDALEPLDERGGQMQAGQEHKRQMRPERDEAGAHRFMGLGRGRTEGDRLEPQNEGAEGDQQIAKRMATLPATLEDLGIEVSTGRVVDFRVEALLRLHPEEGTVPLLYPAHISSGEVVWPSQAVRKPGALLVTEESARLSKSAEKLIRENFK